MVWLIWRLTPGALVRICIAADFIPAAGVSIGYQPMLTLLYYHYLYGRLRVATECRLLGVRVATAQLKSLPVPLEAGDHSP